MPQAVAYIRVSDPKQVTDGNSLVTQESQTRAYVRAKNYTLDRLFIEPGESAKTDDRPILKEMLAYCRTNKGRIDVVIIPKIDRLARQIYDYIGLKTQLQKLGIRLESIGERLEDSPVGRFTENILASVAQFDNEIRAERSKGGMIQAVREGRWVWKAPKGYRNTRFNGKVNIEPDPQTAPLIAEVFLRLASGVHQVKDVRSWLSSQGLHLSRSHFHHIIANRLYLGEINMFGETVQASPPFVPLVSRQVFASARLALAPRKLPRTYERENPSFPLRGTIRCQCGHFYQGAWSKGKSRRYAYYLCQHCPKTNLPRGVVEQDFVRLLGKLQPRPGLFEQLKKAILAYWKEATLTTSSKKQRLENEIQKSRELQQAISLKNATGIIPDPIARKQIEELGDRILCLEAEIPDETQTVTNPQVVLKFAEEFLSRLSERWLNADIVAKKRMQRIFFPNGVSYSAERGFRTPSDSPFTGVSRLFRTNLSLVVDHQSKNRNLVANTKQNQDKRSVLNQEEVSQTQDVACQAWETFLDLYQKLGTDPNDSVEKTYLQ